MANSVLNYIINVIKKGDGDKQTVSSLTTLKSVMTGIGVAAGVATTAYIALDRTLGEASRKTVKYAEEVRKLSSITNQGAAETSKLLQTMDDFKISADQLTVASKKLSSQGLSPTVETMARLSDEYLKINDGAKRAEFLTKNFGKAGLEMAEAMQAGGDAIRKASGEINKNLILTEKQVRQARDLEIAQDNLNDVTEAYAIAIGSQVIPVQVELLRGIVSLTEETNNLNREEQIRLSKMEAKKEADKAYAETLDMLNGHMQDYYQSAAAAVDETESLNLAMSSTKDSGAEMAAKMVEASLAMDGLLSADDVQKLLDFRLSMGLLTQEEYNAAQQALTLKGAIEGLPAEKQIDISVYYHTYGFMPGQLLSNNAPRPMTISEPGGGSTVKVVNKDNFSTTSQRAMGGLPGSGWTVVGEHGKELIDPGGYIHSNAESRRLIAAGVTPFRGLAAGGSIGFSEPGDVFNPVVKKTGIAGATERMQTFLHSGGFTRAAAEARAGGEVVAVSPTASIVQAAQTTALINQSQVTTQSAATIGQAAAEISSSTKESAILSSQQNEDMLALLESINAGVRDIPRATVAAAAKVIA